MLIISEITNSSKKEEEEKQQQQQRRSWAWRCILLIPAFGRQSQVTICEFEASLVYTVNSRPDRVT